MKLIRVNKSGLKSLLLGTLFYFILIDSGGPIGIRNISILFFVLTSILILFNTFSKKLVIIDLSIFLLIFVGLLSAILNSVEITSYISWIYFLIFLFIISKSLLLFSEKEIINSLIISG